MPDNGNETPRGGEAPAIKVKTVELSKDKATLIIALNEHVKQTADTIRELNHHEHRYRKLHEARIPVAKLNTTTFSSLSRALNNVITDAEIPYEYSSVEDYVYAITQRVVDECTKLSSAAKKTPENENFTAENKSKFIRVVENLQEQAQKQAREIKPTTEEALLSQFAEKNTFFAPSQPQIKEVLADHWNKFIANPTVALEPAPWTDSASGSDTDSTDDSSYDSDEDDISVYYSCNEAGYNHDLLNIISNYCQEYCYKKDTADSIALPYLNDTQKQQVKAFASYLQGKVPQYITDAVETFSLQYNTGRTYEI